MSSYIYLCNKTTGWTVGQGGGRLHLRKIEKKGKNFKMWIKKLCYSILAWEPNMQAMVLPSSPIKISDKTVKSYKYNWTSFKQTHVDYYFIKKEDTPRNILPIRSNIINWVSLTLRKAG